VSHLEEQLQRDVDRIRDKVREMADLALRALEEAVKALTTGDTRLAYAAILRDSRIDDLESIVDGMCVEFMVRHIPVAKQLRFSHMVARIVGELERVGDYAESINRQAILLARAPRKPDLEPYGRLAHVAIDAIRSSVRAFLDEDLELAESVYAFDAQANTLHQEIYRALISQKPEGPEDMSTLFSCLSVANRLERVADQASNIAEEVFYIVTGEMVRHTLHRDLRILFVSSTDSCRSLMAEGIARTIAGDHFEFFSAGVGTEPADQRAIDFLKRRGIDVSDHRATALERIEDIGRFKAVVAIGPEAASAIPPLAYRAILLEWDVENPSTAMGEPPVVTAEYEKVFEELVERISELIRSLHGTIELEELGERS